MRIISKNTRFILKETEEGYNVIDTEGKLKGIYFKGLTLVEAQGFLKVLNHVVKSLKK